MSRLVLGGRYRLDEVIGRGRAATVWRAWDAERECQVAVKVLDAGWRADEVALARLRRDTRTLASLAHPNIVAQAYQVDGVARLYRDGRLTSTGFAALPDLAAIAASLPAAGRPEEAPPPPPPPAPAVPR